MILWTSCCREEAILRDFSLRVHEFTDLRDYGPGLRFSGGEGGTAGFTWGSQNLLLLGVGPSKKRGENLLFCGVWGHR